MEEGGAIFSNSRLISRLLRAVVFAGCLLVLIPVGLLAPGWVYAESRQPYFYYYNPDSLQNNLGRLKKTVDSCLAGAELFLFFQPFANLADFDRQMRRDRPAFILAPEWYLVHHGKELGLRPLMRSSREGRRAYRKVLVARRDAPVTMDQLGQATLAMTTLGPESQSILQRLVSEESAALDSPPDIITVSKDMDALIALVLGQVDLALVVRENIDQIHRINPNLVERVLPLAVSNPIPMPVLCYTEGMVSEREKQRLTSLFFDPEKIENCNQMKEMLLIDEWLPITD